LRSFPFADHLGQVFVRPAPSSDRRACCQGGCASPTWRVQLASADQCRGLLEQCGGVEPIEPSGADQRGRQHARVARSKPSSASIVATMSSHRTGLSLLLDLVRLRINECDCQAAYAVVIAEHLRTNAGRTLQVAAIVEVTTSGRRCRSRSGEHLRYG